LCLRTKDEPENLMASNTAVTERRRARTHQKAGRARKKQESQHSTPSYTELFAAMGEPGKAAPKAGGKASKK
jgi:hypothetical protein